MCHLMGKMTEMLEKMISSIEGETPLTPFGRCDAKIIRVRVESSSTMVRAPRDTTSPSPPKLSKVICLNQKS